MTLTIKRDSANKAKAGWIYVSMFSSRFSIPSNEVKSGRGTRSSQRITEDTFKFGDFGISIIVDRHNEAQCEIKRGRIKVIDGRLALCVGSKTTLFSAANVCPTRPGGTIYNSFEAVAQAIEEDAAHRMSARRLL